LGRVPDGFAALGPGDILHVGFLAFDLLKTKDIGLRRLYRLDQALFRTDRTPLTFQEMSFMQESRWDPRDFNRLFLS